MMLVLLSGSAFYYRYVLRFASVFVFIWVSYSKWCFC